MFKFGKKYPYSLLGISQIEVKAVIDILPASSFWKKGGGGGGGRDP